jgi:hypothetical protein
VGRQEVSARRTGAKPRAKASAARSSAGRNAPASARAATPSPAKRDATSTRAAAKSERAGAKPSSRKGSDGSLAVDAYLAGLVHPRKAEVVALRELFLGVDPRVREEVKWNAPSFRLEEHFATLNVRGTDRVLVVLHRGAKVRPLPPGGLAIDDPAKLLTWLGKDRCTLEFRDVREIRARSTAVRAIVKQWIERL